MSCKENSRRTLSAEGFKKTTLATSLALSMGGLVIASLSTPATAALGLNDALVFAPGVLFCIYGGTDTSACMPMGTDIDGSYFSMDGNGDGTVQVGEKTPITSLNGIIIGLSQTAGGSHPGTPGTGTFMENPDIDEPWNFFKNTGMHQTTSPVTVVSGADTQVQQLDFSGWNVTWNGIPSINMGGGPQDCGTTSDDICLGGPTNAPIDFGGTYDNGTGLGTLTCQTSCGHNETFMLEYSATVPQGDPSGFGGVPYVLSLTGTIILDGTVPTVIPDTAATIFANPIPISVLDNDDTPLKFPFFRDTVTAQNGPSNGTTAIDTTTGVITYTPLVTGSDYVDTFDYTVENEIGISDPAATVTVTVTTNVPPQAVDDTAASSTAVLDQAGIDGKIANIPVLDNDTDSNNSPGLPGGIDNTKQVTIVSNATVGTCTANADGTITYTQLVLPTQAVTESCIYNVSDIDPVNGPLPSNDGTLTITVTKTVSDWDPNLPANIIPILSFEPGVFTVFNPNGSPNQAIMPDKSWFSMQVSDTSLVYTAIEPGPDGGFNIGYNQPASGSHTGKADGSEQPGYSAPWRFFANTGFDLTRNGGITANPDGTLDFFTKYVVTWNSIPVINLGGSSQFPEDLGFAVITCSDKPCQNGSTYTLSYKAHVEDVAGAESGFNAVPYELYQEGTVIFLDGTLDTSAGTITFESRTTVGDPGVSVDTEVDQQCVGSCFDYTIGGFTALTSVSIVLPLTGGVPNNAVWRILDNGTWRSFDTSAGDAVKSAPAVAGAGGLVCPVVGDAAYTDLDETSVGDKCIQLSITDNGLNDLDPADGVISDPSGLGGGGSAGGGTTFVDTRTSSNSGCTIADASVSPAQRSDWWLLAGFLAMLGWVRKRVQH